MDIKNGSSVEPLPRRSIIGWFFGAATAWLIALFGVPLARFGLFPLRGQGSQAGWSDLGPLGSYVQSRGPVTQLVNVERRDGWQQATEQQSVYVVGGSGTPRVFSSICPHLGCTIQWRGEQGNFVCPCHGGTYSADGERIAGPPNRGMDELPTRVQDGHLQVQFEYFRQLQAAKEVVD